jgi:hypothetical protein
MSKVIRIDDEVWAWLQLHAEPLEDTPNTVLRRLANLDSEESSFEIGQTERSPMEPRERSTPKKGERTGSGKQLNVRWDVGARHALYHKDGNYYNHLTQFPGALFDPKGYVLFKTKSEYERSPYLQHGTQLHVPLLLSAIPGYTRMV